MIDAIFGRGPIVAIVLELLMAIGSWFVFKKCERKKWIAFIPGLREYQLSLCVDREKTGRKLMVATIAVFIIDNIMPFIDQGKIENYSLDQNIWVMLFLVADITFAITAFVYTLKIFAGLCDLFGVTRSWLWLVILVDNCVPICIWGFFKKFQPKVIYVDDDIAGAALSGQTAKVLDSGLTVNIEERTAGNFLKKSYLLRDIHMNIEPGHMVLLLGGSGAGKTTFVNAVNGYEPAKAQIVLNGSSIYGDYDKMKYRIGFVPQQDLMRMNDTVYNTIIDAAKLRLPTSMDSGERKERAMEVLKFFGLEPVKGKLVEKLSGGQKKRLSIAMEYISYPDLFILDEPDSGLDGVMARELMEGLRKIADQGKIVIVITHSPDRVIDLFDDVIVLAKDSKLTGRLAYFGSIERARGFFEREEMERIVLRINRKEEGGEGLADQFIEKYAEVCHG